MSWTLAVWIFVTGLQGESYSYRDLKAFPSQQLCLAAAEKQRATTSPTDEVLITCFLE